MTHRPLTIFIAHCSDLLTDHRPHGDGLIAHGFISHLAERGHILHVAVQKTDLCAPLPENVTLYKVPTRYEGMLGRAQFMCGMRRLFKKLSHAIHFDVIHQLNPVFVGMSLALTGTRVPLVLGTFVARWPNLQGSRRRLSLESCKRLVADRGRHVIAGLQQSQASALLLTTPAAKNRIPKVESLAKKIHYLAHGIDAELFHPVERWDSDEVLLHEQTNPSILFLANVWRRKGIFTLLDAFEQIAAKSPACRLTIAGNGADMAEVKKQVSSKTWAGRVDFLGHVKREDTVALYQKATLYCLPSLGEPYATTVLEAMSCGRPLVVTNAGGLPFMVSVRGAAIVPPDDADALASAIANLLAEPQLRRSMGKANREHIVANMTWDTVTTHLEAIYEQVIEGNSLQSTVAHALMDSPKNLKRSREAVIAGESRVAMHAPQGEMNS